MDSSEVIQNIRNVRDGSKRLSVSSDEERKEALSVIANALDKNRNFLFQENKKDLEKAKKEGIKDSIYHRLVLSDEKLDGVIIGLRELIKLPDPLGRAREKRELDSGFILEKRSFPIGVIAMIFEARPDALVQIAGLALRSGNGIILKGGREAMNSNSALVKVIKDATEKLEIGNDWILSLESRDDVNVLLKADGYVDLIIPRGSNAFVSYVMKNTNIAVLGHADGLCTTYIDEYADVQLALKVALDAKVQYPAACNATETFLVHKSVADKFIPEFKKELDQYNVVIHADERVRELIDAEVAMDSDWDTEYLDYQCAIKIVDSIEEAIEHINTHGSHHTDAIITENKERRDKFFLSVDSADVFCNCSTRFADGFRFGLGAEVGISTSKLHARGPVGLEGLTTTKWLLSGHGETVKEYSGKNAKSFTHKELM